MRHFSIVGLGLLILFITACPSEDTAGNELGMKSGDDIANLSQEETNAIAANIWNKEMTEYHAWNVVPGTDVMQFATDSPHGKYLTVYSNEVATATFNEEGAQTMPEGAIFARDNFGDDKNLIRVTVMRKLKGQWFFGVYDPQGNVELSGQLSNCISCHSSSGGKDNLFFWREN